MNNKGNKSEEEAIAALISVIDTRIIELQFELKETESNYNDKNVTSYQKGLYKEAIHAIKQRTEELQRNRPLITGAARNLWQKAVQECIELNENQEFMLIQKMQKALQQKENDTVSAIERIETAVMQAALKPKGDFNKDIIVFSDVLAAITTEKERLEKKHLKGD